MTNLGPTPSLTHSDIRICRAGPAVRSNKKINKKRTQRRSLPGNISNGWTAICGCIFQPQKPVHTATLDSSTRVWTELGRAQREVLPSTLITFKRCDYKYEKWRCALTIKKTENLFSCRGKPSDKHLNKKIQTELKAPVKLVCLHGRSWIHVSFFGCN